MTRPKIVSICGNIGCGKSSLLRMLESKGYHCYTEAVSDWKELLESFYTNPQKYFVSLQMRIISDQTIQRQNISKINSNIVFVERTTDDGRKVFIEANKILGNVEQVMINEIDTWINIHEMGIQPDFTIYLENEPLNSLERIKNRKGPGDEMINLEYLELIHLLYQKNYAQGIKVDSQNLNMDQVLEKVEEIVARL